MKKLSLTLIIVLTSLSVFSQNINDPRKTPIFGVTVRYIRITSEYQNNSPLKKQGLSIEYAYFSIDAVGTKANPKWFVSGYTPREGEIAMDFTTIEEVIKFTNENWASKDFMTKKICVYIEGKNTKLTAVSLEEYKELLETIEM